MLKSIIVAKTENHVIGKDNHMPWHLPNDLKHFRQTTLGHHVIMGRKTFESLPNPLKDRKIIIITHHPAYNAPGCYIANALQEALHIAEQAGEKEVFIAGGGTIYHDALPITDQIYLTAIKAEIPGDTFFPSLNLDEWQEISRVAHQPNEKHAYAYAFIKLVRTNPSSHATYFS